MAAVELNITNEMGYRGKFLDLRLQLEMAVENVKGIIISKLSISPK
jgi:hypothetical protein